MKKKIYYYKVVTNDLTSSSIENQEVYGIPLKVQYKIGEFVKSNIPGLSLFLFKSFDYAHNYVREVILEHGPILHIYKVEAKYIKHEESLARSYDVLVDDIKTIIKRKAQKKSYNKTGYDKPYNGCYIWHGTLFAKEVKLIERVS